MWFTKAIATLSTEERCRIVRLCQQVFAILTGGAVNSEELGLNLESAMLEHLGHAMGSMM